MRAGFLALRASLEDEAIAAELAGDGAAGRDLTPAELVGLGVAAVGRSRCLHCRQGLIDERAPVVQRGSILKCGPGALRAGMLQCGWASVRRGGRTGAHGDVRAAGPADRPQARDRGGDAPAGGATVRAVAGGVGGGGGGRVNLPRRCAERSRLLCPNRGRLRHAGWSPPRGGTLRSLAALASPHGHGALTRATDVNLVALLSRTRSSNRLATPRLVSAHPNHIRAALLRPHHRCTRTAPDPVDRERHNGPHETPARWLGGPV